MNNKPSPTPLQTSGSCSYVAQVTCSLRQLLSGVQDTSLPWESLRVYTRGLGEMGQLITGLLQMHEDLNPDS